MTALVYQPCPECLRDGVRPGALICDGCAERDVRPIPSRMPGVVPGAGAAPSPRQDPRAAPAFPLQAR